MGSIFRLLMAELVIGFFTTLLALIVESRRAQVLVLSVGIALAVLAILVSFMIERRKKRRGQTEEDGCSPSTGVVIGEKAEDSTWIDPAIEGYEQAVLDKGKRSFFKRARIRRHRPKDGDT